MTIARYWRISEIQSLGNSGLELSEIKFQKGGVRLDSSALITCTINPDSGSLTNLNDNLTTNIVFWSGYALSKPNFKIDYDMGSDVDIEDIHFSGGDDESNCIYGYRLEYYDATNLIWKTSVIKAGLTPALAGFFRIDTIVGDPNFSDVNVLLAFNGTDESTTFTNSATGAGPVDVNGSVFIDPDNAPFAGVNSARFNGSSWLQLTASGGLGQDFTLEFYLFKTTDSGYIFNNRTNGNSGDGFDMSHNLYTTTAGVVLFGGITLALNTWHKIEYIRSGNVITRRVNGVVNGTSNFGSLFNGETFKIGGNNTENSGYLNGWISQFRCTKNVARTEENLINGFSAPTSPGSANYSAKTRPNSTIGYSKGYSLESQDGGTLSNLGNYINFHDSGAKSITGNVSKAGLPANIPIKRRVSLFNENDNRLIKETWSDSNGDFIFENVKDNREYLITVFDHLSEFYPQSKDNVNSGNIVNFVIGEPVITPTHKIEGNVYNHTGTPIARKVCVFSKTTDQFLGSSTSNASDGSYTVLLASSDPTYVVCFPIETEDINAKIYDRVIPVVI